MTTRSSTAILGSGYLVTSASSDTTPHLVPSEFTGNGTNTVRLRDKDGRLVHAKPASIQVFVSTQFYPPSWWNAEQDIESTIITLSKGHKFPKGAPCTVYYQSLL